MCKLNIKNAINSEFEQMFMEYLNMKGGDISLYDPRITAYMEEYLRSNITPNYTKGKNNIKNFDANLYNFALFKTGNILNNLKDIKKKVVESEQEMIYQKLLNVQSAELDVEQYQVEHITQTTAQFANGVKLLVYVTEQDKNVRDTHRLLQGTSMFSNDSRWNRVIKEMEAWNCRCTIEVAQQQILKPSPDLGPYKESYSISDVDVMSGKVITFNEQHPVFENADPILRKKYKKQDWGQSKK
jgi:hypothetical protein